MDFIFGVLMGAVAVAAFIRLNVDAPAGSKRDKVRQLLRG